VGNLGEGVSECKIFIDTVSFGFFVLIFRANFFPRKFKTLGMAIMKETSERQFSRELQL